MGKFLILCRIKLKFHFCLYKKRWHASWKFQLEISINKKVIAKKPLTNLYEMNSSVFWGLWKITRQRIICMYSEVPFIRNPFIRKTRDPDEIRRERIFCAVICPVISGNPRSGTGQKFSGTNLCIYLYFLLVNPEESLALGLNRLPLFLACMRS